MVENHPHPRPRYGREQAFARAPDQHDRRAQARRAAEALFSPKPPVSEQPADPSPRPTRVLRAEAAPAATGTPETPKPAAILADYVKRIRAWKRYGMTVSQIAEVCGTDIAEIERLLRQA